MVTQKSTALTLTAVIHQEDDLYVAECPEAGTVSQGYTIEEALANLREATELYLEEFPYTNHTMQSLYCSSQSATSART
jgi:predicted RNase H-like HicB family nuclease